VKVPWGRSRTRNCQPSSDCQRRSALTVRTFCSTVRSTDSGSIPGRSKATSTVSLSERMLPVDDPDHPLYTMAQVTQTLGVTAPVLRRWERVGLVRPERTAGGQRRYSRREIERLRHVAQLVGEGMTTGGIRRVLDLEQRIGELEDRLAARDRQDPPPDRPAGNR
jgi:MerR family transcriptional regulator, heat shock protein HspR